MNPITVRPLVIAVAVAAFLGALAGGAGAWYLQTQRWTIVVSGRDKDLEHLRRTQAEEIAAINRAAAAAVVTAQQRAAQLQRDAALIDETHTRKLADALAQNDDMRRRLERGERVRIAGACAPADAVPGSAAAAGAAGVGYGTVELSPAAGRAAADLRASLIKDQNKVETLQRYIRDVCLVR